MLKSILYLGAALVGSLWALVSPLVGAIACTEAYLLNPKALLMEDFGFRYQLCTTAAFLLGLLFHARGRLAPVGKENRILVLMWVFVFVCMLSATWAEVDSSVAFDMAYELFKTVLVSAALVWALRSTRDLRYFVTAMIIGVLHAGFLHTFGLRLGFISAALDRELGVMLESQPTVMVVFLPLLFLVAAQGKGVQRLLACAALPFALNSIVKSYQRAAFVGLLVDAALLLLVLPKRLVLRLLSVGAALVVLFVVRLTPDNYWEWVDTIQQPTQEGSAASRLVLADASLRMLEDHPFGVGYKNYQFVSPRYLDSSMLTEGRRSAHNSYFAVLCEPGPGAFIPWVFAIGLSILTLRRVRKAVRTEETKILGVYAASFEIGLYGWLTAGFFHDVHDVDPVYWIMGLAVLLPRLLAAAQQSTGGDTCTTPATEGDVVLVEPERQQG